MSGPSYRLQTPRPRQPPSPLNFDNSFKSSSLVHVHQDSQTLLYDLPSATTISPPTSPRSPNRVVSPSSPSFPGRSRGIRSGRPTPPPSSRNRSTTPSGVASSELEQFAEHCRAWYYCQDDNAGRLMTQTLATLPPSQRAPFSRLQASIRSSYHRSVNLRRHAEFQAHLSATTPGGSLMPHARANPRGKLAQKERYERMERFIRNWCNMGMPGTKPFFEALWAIMRLQVIPENLGGAGRYRIEWELDDAVFKEAAQALAFEETPSFKIPSSTSYSHRKDLEIPATHSRAQSQPLPSNQKPPEAAPAVQPKRARAPSDPFLDAPQSRSLGSSSHSPNAESILASTLEAEEPPPSPIRAPDISLAAFQEDSTYGDGDEQYLRVWTSPDLDNPEFLQLLKLFPSFVTRRPLPRFPVQSARHVDIEEGEDEGLEGRQIHFGTGSMWVSSKQRSDAWEGGWFTRFLLWWRKLFC
ncbi:hypothetical protein CVT24_004842 [Panaeolus cyanescens]|uniref:Uncharacterized protein n=1 Tax=Panaeolus cyanescens TaxID=181874 RepID=A0A409VQ72_9AGAR|nr:hypothetical protein CVT24_004842 [Panaeolus cyanescens]